jgi:pyridoxine 5'-phosphate synthase PdxJ
MNTIEKKSLKVGKQVNTDHVNTIIKNYKKERWVHNSNRLGKEDSLSVWYSIEELEEFIAMSKEHGADGIKLYFGVYDSNYEEQPLYAGRQTVALVATKQKLTAAGESNKDIYIQTEKGATILSWNAGGLCPPFCGKDKGFGEIGITILDKGDEGMVVA